MKANIHPDWHHDAIVTCNCGNTFTTGSTKTELHVEICSACHPFFTGEMRFVDVQGRVDKFKAKVQSAKARQAQTKMKSARKKDSEAKSYQQILIEQKAVLQKSKKSTAPLN